MITDVSLRLRRRSSSRFCTSSAVQELRRAAAPHPYSRVGRGATRCGSIINDPLGSSPRSQQAQSDTFKRNQSNPKETP